MRTEPTKRFLFPGEPLRLLPIVFMSLFAMTAAADAMIALQPSVLRPLRDSFQHWAGAAGGVVPSWASVFATGVAMAGIAITASLLSVFVRGVQKAPYMWLAPIVVCAGAALMARLPVDLPVAFSAPAFTLLSACAVLGGGAMLRRDAFSTRFAGVLVMATPLLLLAIGYSQGTPTHTPQAATEFVFLLAVTTFTSAVLAWVTREREAGFGEDGQGEQLVALLERARTAEARATFAEQQLASAGYGSFAVHSPQPTSDFDELARMRGGSSSHTLLWAAVLFLIGIMATGYFAGYMPLQNRLEAQHQLAQTKDEQNVAAMKALRSSFDSERSELQAQLRAARAPAAAAPAPAATVEPQAAPAAIATPKPEVTESAPKAKVQKAEAKPVAAAKPAAAEPAAPPAKAKAAPTPVHAVASSKHAAPPAHTKKTAARVVSAKNAAAKPAAAAKSAAPAAGAKAHYDDEALDDDPIGGL